MSNGSRKVNYPIIRRICCWVPTRACRRKSQRCQSLSQVPKTWRRVQCGPVSQTSVAASIAHRGRSKNISISYGYSHTSSNGSLSARAPFHFARASRSLIDEAIQVDRSLGWTRSASWISTTHPEQTLRGRWPPRLASSPNQNFRSTHSYLCSFQSSSNVPN